MKTEVLIESAPKRIVLTVEEAEALIALGIQLRSSKTWWGDSATVDDERRTAIRCEPAGPNSWAVAVDNAIGVVSTGDLQLVIRPKMPVAHLLHLFGLSGGWPRLHDAPTFLSLDADFHEIVVAWFLSAAEALLRAGLLSDYRETEGDLPSVRGTVFPVETAYQYYAGRLSAQCQFEEFDCDTPMNRLVKAAARSIVSNPAIRLSRRRQAERVVLRMDDVGQLEPNDFETTLDRRTQGYQDVVKLARQVLAGAGRALLAGGVSSRGLLITTPDLVESGIRRALELALADLVKVTKRGLQLVGSTMTIHPDLVFDPVAVGDVKYKIDWTWWPRADLYQSVAFATGFGRAEGLVVSVGVTEVQALSPVQVGGVRLAHLVWPAAAETLPLAAEQAFGAAARNWWHGVTEAKVETAA